MYQHWNFFSFLRHHISVFLAAEEHQHLWDFISDPVKLGKVSIHVQYSNSEKIYFPP